jgi:hypothetical protein
MQVIIEILIDVDPDDPANEKKHALAERMCENARADGYRVYGYSFKEA